VALAAASCVKAGFDATRGPALSSHREARATDSRLTDRAPDAACKLGLFSPAVNLASVNTDASEYSPSISTDGLTLIFGSPDRPGAAGNGDLWIATRASTSDAFGPPAPMALDTAVWEGDPDLSFDGRVVYFDRGPAGSGARDLYVATRDSAQGPFTGAALVPGVSGEGYDGGASISADGLELFFTSDRAGRNDIWVARRTSDNAPFSTPELVEGVNSASADGFPSLSGDGLTLYFETDRGGQIQIWTATRATKGAPFTGAAPVAAVNSAGSDGDPEISADGRTLYFTSDRAGKGGYDIWFAVRSCVE
jgi:Tol biopolymer transport system component